MDADQTEIEAFIVEVRLLGIATIQHGTIVDSGELNNEVLASVTYASTSQYCLMTTRSENI